ncbi:hypothetical protein ACVWZP_002421 [Pseudomonas sp. TE36184]
MGWTWKDRNLLLQMYPSLALSPILLERWPGLKEAVAELQAKQDAQNSGGSSAVANPLVDAGNIDTQKDS